jgi:hypothetical protein
MTVGTDTQVLGFTTELGKHWEPWMVLRELWCNARDEGGSAQQHADSDWEGISVPVDDTVVAVDWDELELAWQEREDIVVGHTPLVLQLGSVELYEGPSRYVFLRGIRVMELKEPSLYRYNLLQDIYLTEDRVAASSWQVMGIIRDALARCNEAPVLQQVLTAKKHMEHELNFKDGPEPSGTFIQVTAQERGRRDGSLNSSAREVLDRHTRRELSETHTYTSYKGVRDSFAVAMNALMGFGRWVENRLERLDVIIVEELSSGQLSLLEEGRLYLAREVLREAPRDIAGHLLRAAVELESGEALQEGSAADLLVQLVLEKADDLPARRVEEAA